MKTFHGSYIYRGANFIIKFCAKSIKEASMLIDTTPYQIKTYYSINEQTYFSGIIAEPYGSRTVVDYGFGKEKIKFKDLSDLKDKVNVAVDKFYNNSNIKRPVQIEVGEWYFKGCFIQEQNHPKLEKYSVFQDTEEQLTVGTCHTMAEAKAICYKNEVKEPLRGLKIFQY
jgi:hypothetical protein